ncbi:MAG: HNH endonuclease [Pseudomonadota bacterium]
MANGIFLHRSDSLYDDVPSEKYQFPKQYKSRVDQCIGDWIVYLEPSKVKESRGYFGVAKVQMVIEDPDIDGMFVALMEPNSYLDLATPVAFNGEHGIVEQSVLNNEGRISGRAQAAVRIVPTDDFVRIVELGLADEALLPRSDQSDQSGFNDAQEPFSFDIPHERRVEQQLISRPIRDRAFRRTVLRAYCERCAMTGLKIINGGGRAEVEAAHIKPVEHDGPDIVSNGLALSGTAHWMFDRGLLGVDDSLGIMISRHVNDVGAVTGLINDSQKLLLPSRQNDRPHPIFLRWHRENCFKH